MFVKIEDFVKSNKLEQVERLAGRIPNFEEYMHIRYGVTGVRMFTLLLEYVHLNFPRHPVSILSVICKLTDVIRITQQTVLPAWVIDSPEMEEIIKECNFMIIVYVPGSHLIKTWR